jgi:hypothetical protein
MRAHITFEPVILKDIYKSLSISYDWVTFCYGTHMRYSSQDVHADSIRPSFDSIQALLLTSFVLLNDMKAEASWALTGLTCRLAQSLGLHRTTNLDGRDSVPPDAKSKEMTRRKLWWTCVWHDTLTSLSFDRYVISRRPHICHRANNPRVAQ